MTRSPSFSLAARTRASSCSGDASRYSSGSSPCRGEPTGMTSPMDEPGPYPGRSSKFHGPAARSVLQVSVVVAPETIAWIAWSTDGSTGRGGRVREVAAMGCSIRWDGSGADDERAAIGELDALVVAVEARRP